MGKYQFLKSTGRLLSSIMESNDLVKESVAMASNLMGKKGLIKDIRKFKFSPNKLLEFPNDRNPANCVRYHIPGVLFSHVMPTPLTAPRLVAVSEGVLTNILDLHPSIAESNDFVEFIAGNQVLPTSEPLAHRYGGHQFGVWARQLGDGRAILLGQYVNSKGERWELQLKGAGLTPYSRDGDGRAVLRSSIREFLCSEAMYYLGIPTTRAGAIIVSEDKVIRDMLHDGNARLEPTSVVLRLSPSWFRIGSLELLYKTQELDLLSSLLNFIIKEYFPHISCDENKVVNFLKDVYRKTSDLVVAWQTVGFTHGVLNTDNISLLGLTMDYGPFGFMEGYDLFYVPNLSDRNARYCFGQQVQVILFNLMMLTRAVSPFLNEEQMAESMATLRDEAKYIEAKLEERFSLKLGLTRTCPEIVTMLFDILRDTKGDFTMVFREMSETPLVHLTVPSEKLWALSKIAQHPEYCAFIQIYCRHFQETGLPDEKRMENMCYLNPCYTLRNWMAEAAIRGAEKGDFSEVKKLLRILKYPYSRQQEAETSGYAAKPPPWSEQLCLSCSS